MMPENLTVSSADAGLRLDVFLTKSYPDRSRSFFKNLMEDNSDLQPILVNKRPPKAGLILKEGDLVEVTLPELKQVDVQPVELPLDILYEDNDVLIINKAKGMVVHPAAGHTEDTLVNAILFHCKDSLSGINGEKRPGIVHRIDKDTTGALIICKNDHSHNFISEQIKAHSVHRIYKGIVYGNIKEDEGTVNLPLERDRKDRKKMAVARDNESGRPAITHYRVLERFRDFTYMEFSLETGRTHQIRVHMSHIGHPLLGDDVYGPKKPKAFSKGLTGQTLHAEKIGFIHPSTGEYMEFSAPLPEYFKELLKKLSATSL